MASAIVDGVVHDAESQANYAEHASFDEQWDMYTYHALKGARNRTRVLVLDPGPLEEPLRGRLATILIDNCESYEALSYAWGSPEKSHRILLDGGRYLAITESLSAALYRLRHTETKRRLWIDTICIDQANLTEKADQVQSMGSIYRSSTGVLCWLGEDNALEDGARAIKLLNRIGRAKLARLNIGLDVFNIEEIPGLPKRKAKVWKSLYFFFNFPWFRRCWVVQEFAVAPEATLICGEFHVDWRAIAYGVTKVHANALLNWLAPFHVSVEKQKAVHAAYIFTNMIGTRCWVYQDEYWYVTWQSLRSGDKTLAQLQVESVTDHRLQPMLHEVNFLERTLAPDAVINLIDESIKLITSGHYKLLGLWTNLTRLSLTQLISVMRVADATDPRDKIFSMLALANETDTAALQPSYTESIDDVFTRVARYLITRAECDQHLLILEQAQLDPGPGHLSGGLPTWVPDWSQKCVETCTLTQTAFAGGARIYSAASMFRSRVRLTEDLRSISITGGRVGTVEHLVHWPKVLKSRSYDRDDPENFSMGTDGKLLSVDTMLRVLEEIDDPEKSGRDINYNMDKYFCAVDEMICHRERPYIKRKPGESNKDVQIQTLIADLGGLNECHMTGVSQPQYAAVYDEFRKQLEEYTEHTKTMRTAGGEFQDVRDPVHLKHPFTLRWVALAEFYSVCESTGGVVGLVPRATQAGDELWIFLGGALPFVVRRASEPADAYSLIGACYLHGLMAGEALSDPSWSEQEIRLI